ncbi:MAG: 5-methyltetrahydropteroyltriglutamate--homocysteine methyltransferase [Chloroflexi bacterium]|nr:MAG: 5-methyltetrahydropteroyltriglutamate--homocysteine methyltransferase [Chloroflexota bacterium]
MPLLTTTIGAYPKPDYVPTPDWFRSGRTDELDPSLAYDTFLQKTTGDDITPLLDRGVQEVVREQVVLGIDIPTDGEVRRENYIYYHCRHLNGIDFRRLAEKSMRAGSWQARVPVVTGPITPRGHFLPRDWRVAQEAAMGQPVKMTIPGPLTITDSIADEYYGDEKRLGAALADAINAEIRALADAGCIHIQIDEPVFAREPQKALDFGFENLERCFHKVPKEVTRTVHMCCGYPDEVDNEDYPKADPQAYFQLADAIEYSSIQAVSIEDAHRHNDLALLEKFTKTTVILGVIAIARSRVEPVDEIAARLEEALQHIDPPRLMAAPDCGLGLLDRRLVVAKLKNMVAAARAVG